MRFALFLFALSGCSLLSDSDIDTPDILGQTPYSAPLSLSEQHTMDLESQALCAKYGWWQIYKNDELNTLLKNAFTGSPSLAQIKARLVQAQSNSKKSASALFPQASISGERGTQNGNNSQGSDFTLRGAASFELDIWGKNQATTKSSSLTAEAAEEDLHAGIITLSGQIVESWLELLALREQQALLEKQIDVNRNVLALLEKRHSLGASPALSILQQRETLAQTEALLPDLMAEQDIILNRIAYLSGNNPSVTISISDKNIPAIAPLPDIGMPSVLLSNRPDIMAGWMRLQSAQWASQAAKLNRLPDFSLNAGYTTSAALLDGLFNTWVLDLAASIALPVIDGGNRRAEIMRTQAFADEKFHAYREIVLNAVREVEDALTRNTYQDQKISAIERQLEASRSALEQAQLSYLNGHVDYINVLQGISGVQSTERQLVLARLELAQDRVTLYRALGGRSWARKITLEKEAASDASQKGL